jgi:hypothetical protein
VVTTVAGMLTNDPKLINSPLYPTLIDKHFDFDKVKDYNALEWEDYFNRSAAVLWKRSNNKERVVCQGLSQRYTIGK